MRSKGKGIIKLPIMSIDSKDASVMLDQSVLYKKKNISYFTNSRPEARVKRNRHIKLMLTKPKGNVTHSRVRTKTNDDFAGKVKDYITITHQNTTPCLDGQMTKKSNKYMTLKSHFTRQPTHGTSTSLESRVLMSSKMNRNSAHKKHRMNPSRSLIDKGRVLLFTSRHH